MNQDTRLLLSRIDKVEERLAREIKETQKQIQEIREKDLKELHAFRNKVLGTVAGTSIFVSAVVHLLFKNL